MRNHANGLQSVQCCLEIMRLRPHSDWRRHAVAGSKGTEIQNSIRPHGTLKEAPESRGALVL